MPCHIVIIGGGPAGLIAAETVAQAGHRVTVFEKKPTPGRKFLMAGRGGLNITHSEPLDQFMTRYGTTMPPQLTAALTAFPPAALREWCHRLGQPTFIGTSGRVFPDSLKASPLLRAWQDRLDRAGVRLMTRYEWRGWDEQGQPLIADMDGATQSIAADAVILALGGGSWPKLGSDGGWVDILAAQGVPLAPLRPANCGFVVPWSPVFRDRFAGQPVKPVALSHDGHAVRGEITITQNGIEGGAVYALSSRLRDAVADGGQATVLLDLCPDVAVADLARKLDRSRAGQSWPNYLRKAAGLSPLTTNLLREAPQECGDVTALPPPALAALVKALPLRITAPFALERAISSAGGVAWDGVDDHFMLRQKPGTFVAGEMLDWEAPTGGYLLQACFATGIAAARGALRRVQP